MGLENEVVLGTSVDDRVQELIDDLYEAKADKRSTDGVSYSLWINSIIKNAQIDVRKLIGDSGLDGRFKRSTVRSRAL